MKKNLLIFVCLVLMPIMVLADGSGERTAQRWDSIIATATSYANKLQEEGYNLEKVWMFIGDMQHYRSQFDSSQNRGKQEEESLIKHFQHTVYKTRWELKQLAGNEYTDIRIKD